MNSDFISFSKYFSTLNARYDPSSLSSARGTSQTGPKQFFHHLYPITTCFLPPFHRLCIFRSSPTKLVMIPEAYHIPSHLHALAHAVPAIWNTLLSHPHLQLGASLYAIHHLA